MSEEAELSGHMSAEDEEEGPARVRV